MSNIKIENRTTWNTQELKKLFTLVSKHEGYYPRKVIVYYSKAHRIGGRGTVGPGWVKIGLPNTVTTYNNKTKEEKKEKLEVLKWEEATYTQPNRVDYLNLIQRIAQVYAHELGHNLKLRHKEMVPSRKINVNYVKGIEIHRMIIKKKPTRTRLKPFIYKGFKVKIYKYPHRIEKVKYKTKIVKRTKTKMKIIPIYDNVEVVYGYYYTFLIYKNNKKIYSSDKIFMENNSELKKYIKNKINDY